MGSTFLLLSPLTRGCGNYSTIQRISSHLESAGHSCVLWDPDTITDPKELQDIASQHSIQMVLALHAYKAGRHLLGSNLPFILIFGGTDVNIYATDAEKLKVMTEVVFLAKGIISFSQSLLDAAKRLWPSLNTNKCFEIKQELHTSRNDVFYVILGSMADVTYEDEFMAGVCGVTGVVYLPGLGIDDTHAAIKGSFALVNSSRSEGMAVAILEAMDLGVPVLVRDIPGNRCIVTDGTNGLVYGSPEEFVQKCEILLDDASVRSKLVSNANEYVSKHHSVADERIRYTQVVCMALDSSLTRT
ncbi:glycosyltransferase 1 domain-containing protein 1-like [Mizuhopecten yessoensis]|uniref:Glycosyltransferase 1 domain-containing protein 1 n=1 Tax=Mizuhopecten yessoensis TaxID=6573 RepID=A0A210QQT3_MIZYE|nr:glycosyltransferase 1 domain-containing protein 1-like [Mizuhopecten yessoensis]OWF51095.1 Glycosyltransferase 1 domain-containing protein 1 [Mizuhopecten yessoensis]